MKVNEHGRNVMVGIFVLGALVLMAMLVIWFGENPFVFQNRYTMTMYFPRSAGIGSGSSIFLNNEQVGHIQRVSLRNPAKPSDGVVMIGKIDYMYQVPRFVRPVILTPMLSGKSTISFEVTREEWEAAEADEQRPWPQDGTAIVQGIVSQGLFDRAPEVIDRLTETAAEITELARRLQEVASNLDEFTKPRDIKNIDGSEASDGETKDKLANLSTVIQRFDTTLKYINSVIAKAEFQRDIEVTIKNARLASEDLKLAMGKFNVFGDQAQEVGTSVLKVTNNLDEGITETRANIKQISVELLTALNGANKTIEELRSAATDLSKGDGTAGRFLRDKRLYESLVLATNHIDNLVTELKTLAKQWQEQGMKIKW